MADFDGWHEPKQDNCFMVDVYYEHGLGYYGSIQKGKRYRCSEKSIVFWFDYGENEIMINLLPCEHHNIEREKMAIQIVRDKAVKLASTLGYDID